MWKRNLIIEDKESLMKSSALLALVLLGMVGRASGEMSGHTMPVELAPARQYFAELKKISEADGGRLWGVRLNGPTMFVDPDSRTIVANQADKGGRLKADAEIYWGSLGSEVNIANTATEWSGTYWTMVSWNALSDTDPFDRARLLVHESWHRLQKEIGIPAVMTSNIYLDNSTGRFNLLLEFRALGRALLANDKSEREGAITDALIFRRYRQSQFPSNNENAFERHEGMAEYTGLKLCGLPDSLLNRVAARKLQLGENNEGLANSFPYLTGPAWGLLLDQYDDGWRLKVSKGADLPSLLARAIDWHAPDGDKQLQAAAELAGTKYEAAKLMEGIKEQEIQQVQTAEAYRSRLLAQGRLILPNNNLQFSYNPQEKLISLDSTGVIYKTMRLTGEFGVLEVTDGILRTNDWQFFIVPAPKKRDGDPILGEGYELQLKPGWKIVSKGKGAFILEKN
jgi:hypothetical protein